MGTCIPERYGYFVLILTFCIPGLQVQGQETLPSEEIEVVKDFDARLIDAKKLILTPDLPPLDTAARQYQYQISAASPRLAYETPDIRPLAMRSEKTPEQYQGFVKAGYGFPNAPYGELGYHLITRSDAVLSLYAKHLSANQKDTEDQKFMDNDATLSGGYYVSEALSLNGRLGFSLDDYFLFGYDRDQPAPIFLDPVRRRYHTISVSAAATNNERLAGDINYTAKFDFYRHADDDVTGENAFALQLGGEKWIGGKHPAGLQVITDFSTTDDGLEKQDLHNFFMVPHFTYNARQFKVRIAAKVASHDETYYLFPDLEGSVKILDNRLIVLAGWTGGFEKNNFRSLSTYNPFVRAIELSVRNTNYNHYFAGVRGKLSLFEYSGKVGLKSASDLALFVPDTDYPRKFKVLYDDVDIFHIEGVLRAKPVTGIDLGLTLAKQFYNPENQDKAWHLPGFESNFFASYASPDQKLRLRGDLYLQSAVRVPGPNGTSEKLNSLFDLSVGIDYYITRKIGAFAKINNLAANKFRRWQEYETFGLNAVAGVQARF